MTAFVWYDKSATDERVWCVKTEFATVRAKAVAFPEGAATQFKADGFMDLQPGGPRGIIVAEKVTVWDAESIA